MTISAGTVQYGTKAELENWSEHVMPNIMRTAGSDVVKSNKAYFEFLRAVYLKRLGFAHEHEVRFTYNLMLSDLKDVLKWPSSYYSKGGTIVSLSEANTLLESIEIDPWTDVASCDVVKEVVNRFAPSVIVKQSDLYKPYVHSPKA